MALLGARRTRISALDLQERAVYLSQIVPALLEPRFFLRLF